MVDLTERDEIFIQVIEACEEYSINQEKLGKFIADGLFSLAVSKKSKTASIQSAETMRFDLEPSLRLSKDNGLIENNFEDPILIISGLPPPQLRASQKNFRRALDVILLAVENSKSIQNKIKALNR